VVHFELTRQTEGRLRVAGIPWGEYDATFGTSPHLRSTARGGGEAQRVQIGGTRTRLMVDVSDRGSLILQLSNAEGVPHTDRVSLLLSREDRTSQGWCTHQFTEPPYRIDDLEPGPWKLFIQIPYGAGTSADMPLPVSVAGGTCTELELAEQR
jgi:hypothetical protein